jgi:hypothetical protein
VADWAMVIGVNEYPATPEWSLKGAVQDAVKMTEWLLDPDGGGLRRQNLSLLLSTSHPVSGELGTYAQATFDNIVIELKNLLQKSKGKGDRFYFYFSGHGLRNYVNHRYVDLLLPTDFNPRVPTNSLDLGSIRQRLKITQFVDQFFFIDACRNVGWRESEPITGKWPWPEKRGESHLPPVQQFVFYATTPGARAKEIRDEAAGDERGAFTTALLDGLVYGRGSSKSWDRDTEEYVVSVERMCSYLARRMKADLGDDERDLYQIPQFTLNHTGDSLPELARIPKDKVEDETLNVFLEPSTVVPVARVVVERDGEVKAREDKIPGLPITFHLPPREYTVRATAPDYESVKKSWSVEVYEPRELSVVFVSAPGASTGDGDDAKLEVIVEDEKDTPLDDVGDREVYKGLALGPASSEPPKLVVESDDPLAPLEVADSAGSTVKTGQGRLESTDLRPGYYHVNIRTPEDEVSEKLVELVPGKAETVHLPAPKPPQTRLVQKVVEDTSIQARDDSTLELSEPSEIGPVASPQLSTILTLAGSAANHEEESLSADPLRNLNPKGFKSMVDDSATSGLYLVVGLDAQRPEVARTKVSDTCVRVWPLKDPVPEHPEPPMPFSKFSGLAEYARSTDPGPHWCSFKLPGQKPLLFVLTMLPQRFSLLVLDRKPDGTMQAFQYLPNIESDPGLELQALRQSELMQRFYISQRFGRGYDLLDSSVPIQGIDPLGECMTGYLSLQVGETARLGAIADEITGSFPRLSDGYVLRAEYEASRRNHDAAKASFRLALERGLPVFGYGLIRLHGAIRKYGIKDPATKPARTLLDRVYQHRATGLIWSAWIPEEEIMPGARLAD